MIENVQFDGVIPSWVSREKIHLLLLWIPLALMDGMIKSQNNALLNLNELTI